MLPTGDGTPGAGATSPLSAVEVEVIGSALESICDEMGETLVKASYSPNIKERRDCTTALFDAEGNTIAQAEHIPIHLGSLVGIVSAVRERYPQDQIADGDAFIGNDPHTGGGTHLPDIVLVTPVFVDSVLGGWVTNLAHHADYADRSHAHIFQEGIRIPPLRLVRDWQFVPDVMTLLLANFQVPAERLADFRAQLAANRVGVDRYREVCAKYTRAVVDQAASALLDYTERKTRAGIEEIPDGVYEFSDTFDSAELGESLDLGVRMQVSGDSLSFSFTAPPQVRASVNMVRTALLATVYYAVKCVVGPDIPANSGLHRPISVDAPLGSVLSCVLPAAVNGRTDLCQRVADLALGALAQAVPDKVIAACNGAVTSTTFSGVDPRTGRYYVYIETIGGGLGAGYCFDGLDGVQAHITNTSNLPVESLEAEYPLTVERYELVDASGGPGRHRGGMGIHRQIRVEHDDCVCTTATSRLTSRPWGLLGGLPAASAQVTVNGAATGRPVSTMMTGDRISVMTPGGGGYGPPAERSPDLVADDIRQQRITPEEAHAVYGPAAQQSGPGVRGGVMTDADVAVVGLGAWGSAALWRLAVRGVKVTGFEANSIAHPLGSSHGATRLFRVACWEHPGLVPVARRAGELWRELGDLGGHPVLHQTGALMIGPPDGRAVAGARAAAESAGVPVTRLDRQSLIERFPQHDGVPGDYEGLWDPEAGYVQAEPSVSAMAGTARRAGAEIFEHTTVTGVVPDGDGVLVRTPARDFRFGQAVLAAGPWLAAMRPEIPLTPLRVMLTYWAARERGDHFDITRFPPFIRHYTTTDTIWGHGSTPYTPVKIGLSWAPGRGEETDPRTVFRGVRPEQDWARLSEILRMTNTGIDPSPVEAVPCMVTRTPDGQFVLGRGAGTPRVLVAGGCSGHGFKHAAAIGELAAQLCTDEEPFADIEFMNPARFR